MISSRNKNIVVIIFILGFLFTVHRAKQYFDDRKTHGHDTYAIIKGEKCPDMDMFGFKFSVIIAMLSVNLLATVVLIMSY